MRSSKSRSRNKSNRSRSLGNVVNRVFDSSGPEGKVRGTPQQIIDKYLTLARDAQLSGDRVAEQSFFQHAEHYTRMLGEALREQAERQAQHQQNQQQSDDDNRRDGRREDQGDGRSNEDRGGDQRASDNRNGASRADASCEALVDTPSGRRPARRNDPRDKAQADGSVSAEQPVQKPADDEAPDLVDTAGDIDVASDEIKLKVPPKPRAAPRRRKPAGDSAPEAPLAGDAPVITENG